MATANQKHIVALQAQIDKLRNDLNNALRQLDVNDDLTKGLMQSLEVSTQFNVALLLRLGRPVTLTEADQVAVLGQTLHREDTAEGLRLSVVPQAVGEAAAQAAVHELQQH